MTVMTLHAALGPTTAEKIPAGRALTHGLRYHAVKEFWASYVLLCEDLESVLAPDTELASDQVEAITSRLHQVDWWLLCAAPNSLVNEVGTLLVLRRERPMPGEPLARRLGHLRRLALAVLAVLDGTPPPPGTCMMPEAGGEQPRQHGAQPAGGHDRPHHREGRAHELLHRPRARQRWGEEPPPRQEPVRHRREQPLDVIELLLL